jgi:hypothetical protein
MADLNRTGSVARAEMGQLYDRGRDGTALLDGQIHT